MVSFTIDRAYTYISWRVCPPNPKSLAMYRTLPRNPLQGDQADGTALENFPRATDLFRLVDSDSTITVTEQETLASWSLELQDADAPDE